MIAAGFDLYVNIAVCNKIVNIVASQLRNEFHFSEVHVNFASDPLQFIPS